MRAFISQKPSSIRTLLAGAINTPVGMVVGVWVERTSLGDYSQLPIAAPIAAWLGGSLTWWFYCERNKKTRTQTRAAIAGTVGAILAHPLCWYLLILISNFGYWVLGQQQGSLNTPPVDPFLAIPTSLMLGFFSLIFYGWVTVPLGMIAGIYIHRKYDNLPKKDEADC